MKIRRYAAWMALIIRCLLDGPVVATVLFALPADAQRYMKISAEVDIIEVMWERVVVPGRDAVRSTNKWTVAFSCTLSTNEWQLDGNFSSNARVKWFFDGTNVLRSAQITKLLPDDAKAFSDLPLEEVMSNVTISIYTTTGGYLPGYVGENVPWLAFCSASYLKRPGRIIPLPAALLGHTPDAFAYMDKTETFDDDLGLARRVELFTSAQLYEASVDRFARDAHWQYNAIAKSPFPDGLLKFHYAVTESTNLLGWHLPLKFEYNETIPSEFSGVFRARRGDGRVTGIGVAPPPAGVFEATQNQTVMDWRFRHETKEVNGIIYRWSNDFVAPTNHPLLQARFAKTVASAPYIRAMHKRQARVFVFALIIFIASALPLLSLLKKVRARHNSS